MLAAISSEVLLKPQAKPQRICKYREKGKVQGTPDRENSKGSRVETRKTYPVLPYYIITHVLLKALRQKPNKYLLEAAA